VVSLRNIKYVTKDDYFHMLPLLHFCTVAAEVPSKCSHIILCGDAIIQNVMVLKNVSNLKTFIDSFMFSCILVHDDIFTEFVYVLMLDFYTSGSVMALEKMSALCLT